MPLQPSPFHCYSAAAASFSTRAAAARTRRRSSGGCSSQRVATAKLQSLLDHNFPPVVHSFAYGSGVFAQDNNNSSSNTSSPMVDIIMVVENALDWHGQNIARNAHHYALLPGKSAKLCAWLQNVPPGVYFHTGINIPIQQQQQVNDNDDLENENNNDDDDMLTIKYGVVEQDRLCDDLRDWKYLYLAGRLHKPTLRLTPTATNPTFNSDDEIVELQHSHNLPAALATALLLLADNDKTTTATTAQGQNHDAITTASTTECSLLPLTTIFEQVAAISYMGDFRVQVGAEDPLKVQKLVHGRAGSSSDGNESNSNSNNKDATVSLSNDGLDKNQYQRWKDLYKDSLLDLHASGMVNVVSSSSAGKEEDVLEYKLDDSCRAALITKLPLSLQHELLQQHQPLPHALKHIVAPAARSQAIKGIFTAGLIKSSRYALRKLRKGGTFFS